MNSTPTSFSIPITGELPAPPTGPPKLRRSSSPATSEPWQPSSSHHPALRCPSPQDPVPPPSIAPTSATTVHHQSSPLRSAPNPSSPSSPTPSQHPLPRSSPLHLPPSRPPQLRAVVPCLPSPTPARVSFHRSSLPSPATLSQPPSFLSDATPPATTTFFSGEHPSASSTVHCSTIFFTDRRTPLRQFHCPNLRLHPLLPFLLAAIPDSTEPIFSPPQPSLFHPNQPSKTCPWLKKEKLKYRELAGGNMKHMNLKLVAWAR